MRKMLVDCEIGIKAEDVRRLSLEALIDPIAHTADFSGDRAAFLESINSFTAPQRHVFVLLEYDTEVRNGGHAQFLYNSTGVIWPEVLDAFSALNMPEYRKPLEAALSLLGQPAPLELKDRQLRLEELHISPEEPPEEMDEIDDAFYALDEAAFTTSLRANVRAHASAFVWRGTVKMMGYQAIFTKPEGTGLE